VLPLGVLEYHGEHLPLGMDLLAVTRVLDRLEAEVPGRIVIFPPFAYGAASYAVAGPEGTGTVHLDAGGDPAHGADALRRASARGAPQHPRRHPPPD
jgi:hypothetical protein